MFEGQAVTEDSLLMYYFPVDTAPIPPVREWQMVRASEMRPFQKNTPRTHLDWLRIRKGRMSFYRWPDLRELTEYAASQQSGSNAGQSAVLEGNEESGQSR